MVFRTTTSEAALQPPHPLTSVNRFSASLHPIHHLSLTPDARKHFYFHLPFLRLTLLLLHLTRSVLPALIQHPPQIEIVC